MTTTLGEHDAAELFWVSIGPLLQSHGYILRPRYQQVWVPSWTNLRYGHYFREDSIRPNTLAFVMDATTSSGEKVVLKLLNGRGSYEEKMCHTLNALDKGDPDNHLCPLLAVIDLLDHRLDPFFPEFIDFPEAHVLLVSPMFRPVDAKPAFHCSQETLDFVRQMLQGLSFLHRHNFAHRDICVSNIVIDSTHIVPNGFHFFKPYAQAKSNGEWKGVRTKRRCRVPTPVRYYFIDFESVEHYPGSRESARATGSRGQYWDAPELMKKTEYNPFPVDVHQLGRTFLILFEEYNDMDDLKVFFQRLVDPDPMSRPTAEGALKLFEAFDKDVEPSRRRYLVWTTEKYTMGKPPCRLTRSLVRRFPTLSGIL